MNNGKSNGNGVIKNILLSFMFVLVTGSFVWTTMVFFDMNKRFDNHLTHLEMKMDKNLLCVLNKIDEVIEKTSNLGERVSSLEGRMPIRHR